MKTQSAAAFLLLVCLFLSCRNRDEIKPGTTISEENITKFFNDYPDFKTYKKDIISLYNERNNQYIWFDDDGRNDLAEVLYNHAGQIEAEGVPVPLPYKEKFDKLFAKQTKANAENDLLISSMYIFYAKKVFAGIDPKKSRQLGWYLPREKVSYADYLDELMKDNSLIREDDDQNIAMYYNLRKGLQRYRDMKASGIKDDQGVSIDLRIKTIMVNMERCRWLSPDITDAPEYIAVNIPSYQMRYVRDGKTVLQSDVVVGDEANKTVVFSGKLSYLVFSPYWNIPESIVEKEIQPGIEKDKNYLENHHMEWNGEHIRQKPGKDNSLGLVKFMFPNTNNIYLHDTPAKSLFNKDERALSHGCVRVQKARELAIMILDDDKNWTPEKIDEAMNSGKETQYALKKKIPVYIGYFTALADKDGNVTFYDDVYNRDAKLAKMLYK
jgi:murein L,D-transpeptidase YcbB/YkuD